MLVQEEKWSIIVLHEHVHDVLFYLDRLPERVSDVGFHTYVVHGVTGDEWLECESRYNHDRKLKVRANRLFDKLTTFVRKKKKW